MEAGSTKHNCTSRGLPSTIIVEILKHLQPNERTLSGRLVFREARDCLSRPEDCTASLTQPLPPHAAPWAQEAGQQHLRELAFQEKPRLLCAAAASGYGLNLEAAWAALQPSFFPELINSRSGMTYLEFPCPGVAAVKAGHPQLLNWLVRTCPALLKLDDCVIEAGRHCDLPGLQVVWQAVSTLTGGSYWCRRVLEAAAESATPDAVAKLEWLLTMHSDQQLNITHEQALAAVHSGDLGRLRWLRGRGWLRFDGYHEGSCLRHSPQFLAAALQYADLTTVQWLIDDAGCSLPDRYGPRLECLQAAIKAPDSVAKVQWLQQRGVGITLTEELVKGVVAAAVKADNLEMLLHLQSLCGPEGSQGHALLQQAMAETGACPVSVAMAQQLHAAGFRFSPGQCYRAAKGGHVALLRWLVHEQGVSASGLEPMALRDLVSGWASTPRVLLEVVQLLMDAGYQGWDPEAVYAASFRGDLALTNCLLRLKPCCQHLVVLAFAVHGGCETLLEQLLEQQQWFEGSGCLSCCLYKQAAARGDRATLTALRRLGVPWGTGNVVVQAVRTDAEPPALRWLVEQGAPVGNQRDMLQAVGRRNRWVVGRTLPLPSDVVDWLVNLSVPDWQPTAMPASASSNSPTRTSETAATCAEVGPDPPAAPDGGSDAAAHVLQQQADTEKEGADVAPLRSQQHLQPAPCDGVGDEGSFGAVGPGMGRVDRSDVEEERLAPGAEQERTAYSKGTASDGREPRPDSQAAPDCGAGAANRPPQQQQARMQQESADVAEQQQPLPSQQQHQHVPPSACGGVGDAGSFGAVGSGTGRVGGEGEEEERLAPGAEHE